MSSTQGRCTTLRWLLDLPEKNSCSMPPRTLDVAMRTVCSFDIKISSPKRFVGDCKNQKKLAFETIGPNLPSKNVPACFKTFCCQPVFVTNFDDFETGSPVVQVIKGLICLCVPGQLREEKIIIKKKKSFKSRIEWNGISRGNNIDNGLSPHFVSLFWEGATCSNTGGRLGIPRCSWRPSLNGDCSHGRRNARLTATTSKMEFPYWICGLLMMSLHLHNCVKKSVRDRTRRRMPSDKLILALGNDFATNCLPQSKFWERDGAHNTVYSFMIRSHKDGMHRLDLEHHLVRVPRRVF